MTKTIKSFVLALSVLASPSFADYYSSVDDDTCWDARNASGGNCIEVETEWKSNDKLHVYYNNTCEQRLYIKMCNERKAGGWDCGQGRLEACQSSARLDQCREITPEALLSL